MLEGERGAESTGRIREKGQGGSCYVDAGAGSGKKMSYLDAVRHWKRSQAG